jgi:cytochrome c553
MRRLARVLKWFAVGAVLLAVIGYAILHIGSERIMQRSYEAPLSAYVAPVDDALLAEGERLAHTRGCSGCHGRALLGEVVIDQPWMGKVVAGNLTRVVRDHSDAELERVVRRGVRKDGRSVWMMPSPMFARLSDEDLGSIIAWMRSVPEGEGVDSAIELGPLGRVAVLFGELTPLVDEVDPTAAPRAPDRDDPLALGRYVAITACSECHGTALRGDGMGSPSLAIVGGYSIQDFERLMREGVALGERELPMMSGVARWRFSHFTAQEIAALHAYLGVLAASAE